LFHELGGWSRKTTHIWHTRKSWTKKRIHYFKYTWNAHADNPQSPCGVWMTSNTIWNPECTSGTTKRIVMLSNDDKNTTKFNNRRKKTVYPEVLINVYLLPKWSTHKVWWLVVISEKWHGQFLVILISKPTLICRLVILSRINWWDYWNWAKKCLMIIWIYSKKR